MRLALDHIALAAPRIDLAPAFLVGTLGGVSGYGGPSGSFRWWHWDFPRGGRIEVIEPDGPPGGFVHRFLDRNGPGIHHVTFKTGDLDASCARAEAAGYGIVGYNASSGGWKEAFLHPREAMGVVVQFAQSPPGRDEDDEPPMQLREGGPPEPAERPDPVEIVGLRMVTADADRARAQWGTLLDGQLEERPGSLRFRWDAPGSEPGMRVHVRIESGARDASEAIELRAERPLALSDAPQPSLGTRFVRLQEPDC